MATLLAATLLLTSAPAALAADTTPPTMAAPQVQFVTGWTHGTTYTPVWVTYWASDASGIHHYVVQQSTDYGAWSTAASTTARGVGRWVLHPHYYRFRAAAMDYAGNWSAWAYSPTVRVLGYQESNPQIKHSAGWVYHRMEGAMGGYTKVWKTEGQWFSFTFTGRAVAWIAPKYWAAWSGDVYVDGVFAARVNLYSNTTYPRNLVFTRLWSTSGTHTVLVRVTPGGLNGFHPNVDLDAFVVLR